MRLNDYHSYLAWNTRLALYWLSRPGESQHLYLTITPGSLSSAAWECDGLSLDPEDAEHDFVNAVGTMYRGHVVEDGADIITLDRLQDGMPLSVAFLGVSVLAAYHMRDDGERRSTAYFPRLAELLGAGRDEPVGFSRPSFEALWQRLSDWTAQRVGRPLFLPTGVHRRFEAFPIAHAALRKVDLERLPDFFEWAQYSPGGAVGLEVLKADFFAWLDGGSTLTPRGQTACRGSHQDAAVQQIAAELKAWNGFAPDASGRRVAQVDIALDVPRGIPSLFYLARRPAGFPDKFEFGEHRFDSMSEGWYEPLTIPRRDGDLLLAGFQWESTQQAPACVLRRPAARAIALAPSEDSFGLVSRRRLLAGVDCGLLFHSSVREEVTQRLGRLVQSELRWLHDPSLPEGWAVVDQIRIPTPSPDAVPGLEALEVDAAVELVTRGGLRVGRRAEWLDEAPPQVFVSGPAPQVTIDGVSARVQRDGKVDWHRQAKTPGAHIVVAGRSYKRVSLVAPQLAEDLGPLLVQQPNNTFPLGLARGVWTVLGDSPMKVSQLDLTIQQVVKVPFEPVWAVRNGCALFLADREVDVDDAVDPESGRQHVWASAVLDAVDRRAPIATIDPEAGQHATESWAMFRSIAERIGRANSSGSTRTSR